MKQGPCKLAGWTFGTAMAVAAAGAAADGIPHRQVADMLYLIMSSDRAVYTRMVVQRLTRDEEILTASEHFEDDSALPLPAQMFRFGAERVADETEDFSYSLLSLHRSTRRTVPERIWNGKVWNTSPNTRERISTERRSSAASATSPPCTRITPSRKPA